MLRRYGLRPFELEPCLYARNGLWVLVYVNEVLYANAEEQQLMRFEKYLKRMFKIKVADTVTKYVGFEVREGQRNMTVHCKSYITALCKKFALLYAKK